MILADVITNASKTGRTDVLGRTAYFVNKCSQMFYWDKTKPKYLVEMVEFRQVGSSFFYIHRLIKKYFKKIYSRL
jgi:hypothetical protein